MKNSFFVLLLFLFGCSSQPKDLDCSDIQKRVWVGPTDPHNLDADRDGWGCESYGS